MGTRELDKDMLPTAQAQKCRKYGSNYRNKLKALRDNL